MPTYSRGRTQLLFSSLFLLIVSGIFSTGALAQRSINEADRVIKHGNVHPLARAEFDRGSADLNLPMENMILLLSPSASAKAAMDALLDDLQNPKSPNFHKFLTPQEIGLRFGPTDQDVADAANWLKSHGFRIVGIANSKLWINFTGNVQQVEQAFQTNIRQFEVNGQIHYANATDPSIPRALDGLVEGVVSLHDFPLHHDANLRQLAANANLNGGGNALAPGDFATIYNLTPLYNAGIDGTGQTIAVLGRTDIVLGDVQFFRSNFLLPAKDPVFIHNLNAPGDLHGSDEGEADLDVEWSGAVAKNATIDFVISKSTHTTDGIHLSAQYAVDNNVAPVISTSFSFCEQNLGTENSFWNSTWGQAALQGITSVVSTGDNGAAGCDADTALTGTIQAVSGVSSTPNNVAVGGTEFNDGAGGFWAAGPNPDSSSALGPIPEIVWNESGTIPVTGKGLFATGGGASTLYAKPDYQSGLGVPADSHRDVPDVALNSAAHTPYLIVQAHSNNVLGLVGASGTSAAAPSFAGIMALVVQKTGSPQGNANKVLYPMARAQFAGGTAVFNDITSGNNSVPGVTGFSAGAGYDQATGWGSVNAANLVNTWNNNAPDFGLTASPTSQSVVQGNSVTYSAVVTAFNNYTGTISFSVAGLPAGATLTPPPPTVTNSGSSPITILTNNGATTPVGSYPLTITATDGALTHTAAVTLNVTTNAPDFTFSASPASQTVTQGSSVAYSAVITAVNNYTGTISFSVAGLPAGATLTPPPPAVTNSGSSTITILASSTTPVGTYPLTITASDGVLVHTAAVSLTVNAPDFTFTASPASQSVVQGNSVAYSAVITAVNGYTGAINFSVAGLPAGATLTPPPPTVTNSGSSTITILAGSTTPVGVYPLTITATDGVLVHTAAVTLSVTAPSDFTISATPASQTVTAGVNAGYQINVGSVGGFNGVVSLSVSIASTNPNSPVGAINPIASINPTSLTGSGVAALTVTTGTTTTADTYLVTVTGTAANGTLVHTTSVTLVVNAIGTGDFTMSSLNTFTVKRGQTGSLTVTITGQAGFSGVVNLSVSGLPAPPLVTGGMSPASVTGSGTSSLTVTISNQQKQGTFPLVITGTSGQNTHSVNVNLTII
ncbi:MAG TPA: protease pro-enzyme activation domain-containing protein [Candidatus Angelobacter sp.]|jgi:subtilase family serine protease